jgi:hypothetical protein
MQTMPALGNDAGVNTAPAQSTYVSGIVYTRTSSTVSDVTYTLTNLASDINGQDIEFQGTGSINGVQWICNGAGTTAPAKYLPANCR